MLQEGGRVESLLGLEPDDSIKEYTHMLAECVYHVLTATGYGQSKQQHDHHVGPKKNSEK